MAAKGERLPSPVDFQTSGRPHPMISAGCVLVANTRRCGTPVAIPLACFTSRVRGVCLCSALPATP